MEEGGLGVQTKSCFVRDICGKFKDGYLEDGLEMRGRSETKDIDLEGMSLEVKAAQR